VLKLFKTLAVYGFTLHSKPKLHKIFMHFIWSQNLNTILKNFKMATYAVMATNYSGRKLTVYIAKINASDPVSAIDTFKRRYTDEFCSISAIEGSEIELLLTNGDIKRIQL